MIFASNGPVAVAYGAASALLSQGCPQPGSHDLVTSLAAPVVYAAVRLGKGWGPTSRTRLSYPASSGGARLASPRGRLAKTMWPGTDAPVALLVGGAEPAISRRLERRREMPVDHAEADATARIAGGEPVTGNRHGCDLFVDDHGSDWSTAIDVPERELPVQSTRECVPAIFAERSAPDRPMRCSEHSDRVRVHVQRHESWKDERGEPSASIRADTYGGWCLLPIHCSSILKPGEIVDPIIDGHYDGARVQIDYNDLSVVSSEDGS